MTPHPSRSAAKRFKGIIPPVVTPLCPDGTVDVPSLERLTDHLVTAGVHGLFVLGSTGEAAYLTDAQRDVVTKAVVATAAGRVPVLAGVIDLTTARVRERVAAAVSAGVDGVVASGPIYAISDGKEIEAHFRAIAAASEVPLLAYDIPVRTHVKLDPRMLVRLGCDGALAGVKDSSGDDAGFRRLVAANQAAGAPMTILTGHETVADGMLLLGADGVVPGLANVDAAGYVRLWNLAQEGDWRAASAEQDRLAALFEIVFQARDRSGDAAGVGAFKAAMTQLGLISGPTMAFPVEALEGPVVDRIGRIVAAAGVREPVIL